MIPIINGLRGLAILAVLLEHVTSGVRPSIGPFIPWTSISLAPLIWNGWTGVNLFFILSGFVLFFPYVNGRRTLTCWRDARIYYWRRFLRLMPLYWAAILLELVMAPKSLTETAWLVSGLFSLSPSGSRFWNWPLWSIGVEILFSIALPILVLAWQRLGAWRLVLTVLLVALTVRSAGYLFFAPTNDIATSYVVNSIIARLDEFVLGMLVAKLYFSRMITIPSAFLISTGLVLVLAAWIGNDLVRQDVWIPVMRAPINNVLDLGFTLTLAGALASASRLSGLLSWPPLQILGMMCYSIYIWHVPILRALFSPSRVDDVAYVMGSVGYLLIVLLLAAISYRFIEFFGVREWRPLFLLKPTAMREARVRS